MGDCERYTKSQLLFDLSVISIPRVGPCAPREFCMFGMSFWFGLTLTALILFVGHWLPKGDDLPLPRSRRQLLVRYVVGVGAILSGLAVWLIPLGLWRVVLGAGAFAIAGGLATLLAHLYDWARTMEVMGGRHDRA